MSRRAVWPPRIYHHASGRDRIRVKGVDYYLGATGSAAAAAEYSRLVGELALSGGAPPRSKADAGGVSVDELVARWWLDAGGKLSPEGKEAKQFRRTLQPLLRRYGSSPAGDFDAERLEALRNVMASGEWMTDEEKRAAAKRKRPVTLCRNVLNRRIVRIRTVWRWAEKRQLVPAGSWGNLRTLAAVPPNDPTVRHTIPTRAACKEQLDAVLKKCSKTLRAMLELQDLAGMRPAEVRTMRTLDIDRTDPKCWIYRPGSDAGPCGKHKNAWRGQTRAVPLGPRAIKVVKPFLKDDDPAAFLFLSATGSPYTEFSYPQAVRRACKRAGVAMHPYMLRHGAKQRITRELGLDAARAVLGQKSLDTTNGYGDAIDLSIATAAARKLA